MSLKISVSLCLMNPSSSSAVSSDITSSPSKQCVHFLHREREKPEGKIPILSPYSLAFFFVCLILRKPSPTLPATLLLPGYVTWCSSTTREAGNSSIFLSSYSDRESRGCKMRKVIRHILQELYAIIFKVIWKTVR